MISDVIRQIGKLKGFHHKKQKQKVLGLGRFLPGPSYICDSERLTGQIHVRSGQDRQASTGPLSGLPFGNGLPDRIVSPIIMLPPLPPMIALQAACRQATKNNMRPGPYSWRGSLPPGIGHGIESRCAPPTHGCCHAQANGQAKSFACPFLFDLPVPDGVLNLRSARWLRGACRYPWDRALYQT